MRPSSHGSTLGVLPMRGLPEAPIAPAVALAAPAPPDGEQHGRRRRPLLSAARTLLACLVGLMGFGADASTPVTAVSVLDAEFKLVKALSEAELVAFTTHWDARQRVQAPSLPRFHEHHFKLDLRGGRRAQGRWLYDGSGHLQRLSHHWQPVYRVADPEAFNRLIGVPEAPTAP